MCVPFPRGNPAVNPGRFNVDEPSGQRPDARRNIDPSVLTRSRGSSCTGRGYAHGTTHPPGHHLYAIQEIQDRMSNRAFAGFKATTREIAGANEHEHVNQQTR